MDDILRILEQDARTSPERIAEMTGRPVNDVREIIIEAEKNGGAGCGAGTAGRWSSLVRL